MIIGGTRIRTQSGHRPLADHLWRGAGNDEVATLQGDEADLEDMNVIARHARRPYAIRHLHVSPGEPMTDTEALELVGRIAAEFGFDPTTAVVVKHRKRRRVEYNFLAGTQGYEMHWHLLAPEVDPIMGRVLDSRKMYQRHERLAREAEWRLLHKLTKGRHNSAVISALDGSGNHAAACQLRAAGLDEGRPAYAAYTAQHRRRLERRHADPHGRTLDLPDLVGGLAAEWASHGPTPQALAEALRRRGLRVRHPDHALPRQSGDRMVAAAPLTIARGWIVDAWDARASTAYVLGAAHTLLREPRQRVVETLRPLLGVPEPPTPTPTSRHAGRQDRYHSVASKAPPQRIPAESPTIPEYLHLETRTLPDVP